MVCYILSMRLHRFYISSPLSPKSISISDRELIHQWKKVFRYNVGSQVLVFDGSGEESLCIISHTTSSEATLSVIETKTLPSIHKNIYLCMSVIKKDNFEFVVQKATELGVTHIIPLLADHTEKKKLNEARLKIISIEASEQSGRGDIPTIHPLTTLEALLESGALPQEKIAFHLEGSSLKNTPAQSVASIALFIGPEGGWSEEEVTLFKKYNISIVSLGSQVLRAETAAVAAVSVLTFM